MGYSKAESLTVAALPVRLAAQTSVAIALGLAGGVVALLGGMKYVVLILALYLVRLVWRRPQETIAAGALYLIACSVFFPSAARFDWQGSIWEMYYWAIGILIITVAGILRVGIRKLLAVPTSAKLLLLAAAVAVLTGMVHGATLSYASRQFFGAFLFIVYFALALHYGDEDAYFERLRTYGLILAVCFIIYWVAVFGTYGFHKEVTSVGTQFALISILCCVSAVQNKRMLDVVAGLVTAIPPLLIFARHAILSVAFAIVLALALTVRSVLGRSSCYLVAILILVPSMIPGGADLVLEKLMSNPTIAQMLPEGTRDTNSLLDRGLELLAGVEEFKAAPILGKGFGTQLEWDSVGRGVFAQEYIDVGWAYVAVKMGTLGLVAFGWLLVAVLRNLSRESLGLSIAFLTMLLIIFFSEPVLFQFTTSPFAGAVAGLLFARQSDRDSKSHQLTAFAH